MRHYLGAHLAVGRGYADMVRRARAMDASTFAFFLRNPRGGAMRAEDPEDMEEARRLLKEWDFGPLVAHAPYTLNPAAKKDSVREFALTAMTEDLERMERLPGNYYNFHPGAHVGQGAGVGIERIVEHLNQVLDRELHTLVLLETMAGKGTEIGRTFEEIAEILGRVRYPEKLGVCLDTCHVSDGGYDVRERLDEVLEEFDSVIGLGRLKALHINDSKNPVGSHKDRHALIGEGEIGRDAIVRVIGHPALQGLPMILETPTDEEGHAKEIAMLRAALNE